jgi:hypothetical protein
MPPPVPAVSCALLSRRTVGSQWRNSRYALAEDFAAARSAAKTGALSWMEVSTDTVYGPQWTHPHPSFSPDETKAVFVSDKSGHPQVYVMGGSLTLSPVSPRCS